MRGSGQRDRERGDVEEEEERGRDIVEVDEDDRRCSS
jgi:hypothetical protein